jgi:hypothetical protein
MSQPSIPSPPPGPPKFLNAAAGSNIKLGSRAVTEWDTTSTAPERNMYGVSLASDTTDTTSAAPPGTLALSAIINEGNDTVVHQRLQQLEVLFKAVKAYDTIANAIDGNYTAPVTPAPPPPVAPPPSSATLLTFPTSELTIVPAGGPTNAEYVWVKFVLTYATAVQLDTIGSGASTPAGNTDTKIALFDAAGNLLASDDDGGGSLTSKIISSTLQPGTYYGALGYYSVSFANGFTVSPGSNDGGQIKVSLIAETPPPGQSVAATLLMHFEGSTVTDDSGNDIAITNSGCTLTTGAAVLGSQGLTTNGSYLSASDSRLVMGTEDFTVSCYVNLGDVSSPKFIFDSRNGAGGSQGFVWFIENGALFYSDGASNNLSSVGSPTGLVIADNTVSHVEVGRQDGSVYLFIDGYLVNSITDGSFNNNFASPTYIIFAAQYYPVGVDPLGGSADEFLVTVGTCLHTESFTPPTVAYTSTS